MTGGDPADRAVNAAMYRICVALDELYYHAIKLIGKEKTHDLGHRKEAMKALIEREVNKLKELL